jgi:DNA-binding NtrC family response regulator
MLVVDDEPITRATISRYFTQKGFTVDTVGNVFDAEACLRRSPPDVVILDHRLPGPTGTERIADFRGLAPEAAIVLLTAHGSIELAVEAIKAGAEHFLVKPVELGGLERIVDRLVQNARFRRKSLARSARGRTVANPLVGSSPAIRALAAEVEHLEMSDSTVLIQGETGSGKGMLARWLHRRSLRVDEALVEVNCAGLSRELLESELFGYEKGAFTGALAAKPGLLEAAHRGTLFLDEIGDLDLAVQPKLLTALEDRRFRRLGEVRDRHSDFRLIAATHCDLARRAREGTFRADLYYRIAGLPLRMPPLRERREDIPLLAEQLLAQTSRRSAEPPRLSGAALDALVRHDWPGNVRELRNALERGVLVCRGDTIDVEHLRFDPTASGCARSEKGAEDSRLDEVVRHAITHALAAEGGHVARAAQRLGVPRSSLYKKLKKLGCDTS